MYVKDHKLDGMRKWLQWTALTCIGWLAFIGVPLLWNSQNAVIETAAWIAYGIAMAGIVSALQWLVLRPFSVRAWHWVTAGIIGILAGSYLALPLKLQDWYVFHSRIQLDEVAFGIVFGLILGFCQWLVMRRSIRFAETWILGNAAGWGLGYLLSEMLKLDWQQVWAGLVYQMVAVLVASIVTGCIINVLSRTSGSPLVAT